MKNLILGPFDPKTSKEKYSKKIIGVGLSLYVAVTSLERFHAMIFGNICKKIILDPFQKFFVQKTSKQDFS